MTQKEKAREVWQKRVEEWRASGKTVAAWCQEKGIYKAAFYHWKKQLSQEIPQQNTFIEIKEDRTLGIELQYKDIRIHLSDNFDSHTLLRCIETLKRVPC